jgi:hypothetical protein
VNKDDTPLDESGEREISRYVCIYESKREYKLSYDKSICRETVI